MARTTRLTTEGGVDSDRRNLVLRTSRAGSQTGPGWCRGLAGAIAVVLAVIVGVGTTADAGTSPPSGDGGQLAWQDCGDGFQCATLAVPLNARQPRGDTIDLALIRRPAEDPTRRIGSLVTNPGGPGVSGIDDLRLTAAQYPAELRARFDLVSFDPRGVGASTPLRCLDASEIARINALDPSPDTPDERTALTAAQRQLAEACEATNAKYLRFLTTEATARDLDRIRAALGDQKLTYFGASYGTYLGSIYADLFPKRVRALILDGAVDPSLKIDRLLLDQAVGYEEALAAFFADCAAQATCSLRDAGTPASVFDTLAATVDLEGVPALGNRRLGPAEFQVAVTTLLSGGEPLWPLLADVLGQAARGDASLLLIVADAANQFVDPQIYMAIACLGPFAVSAQERTKLAGLETRSQERAPHFGATSASLAGFCARWPVGGRRPHPIHATHAPPILVIGTEHDPATPLTWAQALAKQLRSGVLLQAPGYSHTSFAQSRSSAPGLEIAAKQCVDDAGVRYLIDLVVPDDPTRCT